MNVVKEFVNVRHIHGKKWAREKVTYKQDAWSRRK